MVWGVFQKKAAYQAVELEQPEDEAEREEENERVRLQREKARAGPQTLAANCTTPQELTFTVPLDLTEEGYACISGPFGPMLVPVPDDRRPGDKCSIKLGPSNSYKVEVPDSKYAGDKMTFNGDNGEELQVVVPKGKGPGDFFEVTPPTLMVQVPIGARKGDQLIFTVPDTKKKLSAPCPGGLDPGQYFAVLY